MFTNNKTTAAVRFALIASVAGATMTTSTAFAAQETEAVERISVTGSKISRSDMETSSPVTVIGAADIAASGAISIDDILQDMTAAGGAMTNPGINNGSGGNARINLRGLGSNRTLVLVNGRRMIASGTGAASTVDLNSIPVSMIQRVEILKDGASAIYGTDAVAGVVNIILKRDYEGFEINLQGGVTGHNDAEKTSIDFTLGTSFDKGNLVLGVQYTDRGDASQADRDYSNCPISETTDDNGVVSLYCGGSSYTPFGHVWGPDEAFQGNADGSWHAFSNADKYNYSSVSFLSTPMQRLNITGLGSYEVSDTTMFSTEFMYTKRWSTQQMAPQPVWFDFVYQDWMGSSLADMGMEYGDEVFYGRRMSDTGSRNFSQVVDTIRTVVALEGEFNNGWTWDVSYNFGRNDSVDRLENLHNIGSIQSAIEEKAFNPLDQTSFETATMAEYLYTEQNSGGSQLNILAAGIAGELMELDAGVIGFAAGLEKRSEKAWFMPDSLTAQGLANDPKVEPTSGSFDVTEAFVEFAIPLLGDTAISESVELSTAARYFDYSTFGDDVTWKVGLTWKINEELMFRSVASTAFRAPSVSELFSGDSPSFDQVSHPLAQDQAQVTVGGNDALTPEEADTLTAGIVYEPTWLEGFSMTFDYYDITIDNAIAEVEPQYIVNSCINAAGTLINTGSALCQSSQLVLDNSGRLIFNNQLQNIGSEEISGYDINLSYGFDAAGLEWKLGLDTSVLSKYNVTILGETTSYADLVTSGSGGYAEVKSNFTTRVSGDNWNVTYLARYIAGMDSASYVGKESTAFAPSVGSVVYHDISGAYHFSNALTLSGGINNLFDKEPPYFSGNNDSNTDPYTYDVLGRAFFVKASFKF